MFDIFFEGFAWLLSAFYSLVPNYGFAIVMLTVTIYLFLFPVTLKQTRSMLVMSRLQPEVARLKKQHKGDSRALMEAQQELFAREGVNPASSCLPMLLQMPVYVILWQVLAGLTHKTPAGEPSPKHLEAGSKLYRDIVAGDGELVAFGVDLAKTAIKGPHSSFGAALPFFVLAALAAAATYVQIKRSQGRNPNPNAEQPPGMQLMTRIMPIMTLMSSLFFPAGLALYFLASAIFRVVQQEAMYRWDPHVVSHSKAAASAIETTAVEVSKEKVQVEAPKKKDKKGSTGKQDKNGSDPSPIARESGRAQPKGTQGRRRKRKKSRR